MTGVDVWLRTKKRSFGTLDPCPRIASQRISALTSRRTNHSGGSGLTMPPVHRSVMTAMR